ncbi:hypothetical protein E8E11_003707 [Didymella keratinophila]|nr:hypothetical protein E8E11_003707 [Didymella keratinophila]
MSTRPSTAQPRKAAKNNNTALARRKAVGTYVYISGLRGVHTLETGLAYYYRGHYIYAYPAGNLIEPIPYSTRKGIMIQGVLDAGAPMCSAGAAGLLGEEEVRALSASVENEGRKKTYGEEGSAEEAVRADSGTEEPGLRRALLDGDLRGSVMSLAALRESGLKAFTPHHGASSLAASAPGSRLASRSASPLGLRPTSSHVGLARLGAIRGHSSPFANTHYLEANSLIEDVPSRFSSALGYLPGLGDHALSARGLARPIRVAPCPIHGEGCDGVSVERDCLTEETKKGLGFVEEVSIIERGGRQMVDWARLLEEARVEEGV